MDELSRQESDWENPAGDKDKYNDPRRLAVFVIERVLQGGAYADIVLDACLEKSTLSQRDRSLATELTYGTLRWLNRLDWVFERVYRGRLKGVPGSIQRIVEVGLYQILFLDKVPSYAAVNEAVNSATAKGGAHWGGVVNAVLRTVIRKPETITGPSRDADPVLSISIQGSHPQWLVRKWIEQFGIQRTLALCAANNTVPNFSFRVNRLKKNRDFVRKSLKNENILSSDSLWHEDFLIADRASIPAKTEAFSKGWFTIQDISAGLVVKLLDPKPGESVVDLAGAPGGKSTAVAEYSRDETRVFSFDRYLKRVHLITENQKRLGIRNLYPVVADGALRCTKPVDKILVDAPCSGLGILRKHPEIKWKRSLNEIPQLVAVQKKLLESASEWIKPDGILVYSTCTVLPEENGNQIEGFLQNHPDFSIENAVSYVNPELVTKKGWVETWPDLHGMDGSFAVRLKKK